MIKQISSPKTKVMLMVDKNGLFNKLFLKLANSIKLIATLYFSSITVSAILISVTESMSFIDGLWWSCVTALTIGYGDISPETPFGRIIAITFSHLWIIVIIPLIIANFIVRVIDDANAFTHEEQEMIKRMLTENNHYLKEIYGVLLKNSEMLKSNNEFLSKIDLSNKQK